MRKEGLLDKKPLTATKKMLEMAGEDKGTVKKAVAGYGRTYSYTEYESRFYFRAAVSANREILEVDLFTRKDLADGRKLPRFRIFLDRERKDFASWNVAEGKWSSARIDMLETGDSRHNYSYRGRNHATKETLNTVNRYLDTGCMQDVEMAVLDFQEGIREAALSRKYKLMTDVIDGYMNMVPDRLPADWIKFVNDRVLEHSIFYWKEEKTGYCTHCRLHVPVPDGVRHNMSGKCSRCGISIVYRSWKRQKHTTLRTAASLLQKCTDGEHYAYRQFRVDMYTERGREYVPEISIHEDYRIIFRIGGMDSVINSARNYEWGSFKHTGINRWCVGGMVNHGGYCTVNYGYSRSIPYTGNLRKLLKETGLEYVQAADIMKSMGTKKINVMAALNDMNGRFPYEAFWKMGLKRFVQERIERDGKQGLTRIGHHKENPKPWDYLKLSKEDIKQAVRLNATDRQIRIIQMAAGVGTSLTDGQVQWLDRYMGAHEVINYFGAQTPHRIIRYLKDKVNVERCGGGRDNELLHFWTDYLDMVRRMGWDLHDRQVFFPQNIRRAHDEAAAVFTAWKDKAEAQKIKDKDIAMRRNAGEIKKAFCYQNNEYEIKVPECFLDFKREGHEQHNCVAAYYDRAVRGECIILFIRRKQAPEESFCTVEIRNTAGKFAIIQNRAAYNRDAPEDARAFMEKAVREAQKTADKMAAGEGIRTAG